MSHRYPAPRTRILPSPDHATPSCPRFFFPFPSRPPPSSPTLLFSHNTITKQQYQQDSTPLPTSSSSSKQRSNCNKKKKKKHQQQQFPHKAENSQGSLPKTQNRNFMDLDEYMMYLDADHHVNIAFSSWIWMNTRCTWMIITMHFTASISWL